MRLPRMRLTVRRTMIAVAIVGLGLGAETARKRWSYLDQARHHAREGRRHREFARQRIAEGQFHLAGTVVHIADWAEHVKIAPPQAPARPFGG